MQTFLDTKRGTGTRYVYGKQLSQPMRSQPCPDPLPGTTLTCHVLYPPGGTWLGRPPGEHSKLGQVSTQSVCSVRRCDTAGRSESAAHQKKNDCHPKARGSVKDGLSPERDRGPERLTINPLPRTSTPINAGMVARACDPSTWRPEEGGNKVRSSLLKHPLFSPQNQLLIPSSLVALV